MLVISDTSPLNYLILIDAAPVLQTMYGRVIIGQVTVIWRHPSASISASLAEGIGVGFNALIMAEKAGGRP